jgi:mannitol 2-dehydrogenase
MQWVLEDNFCNGRPPLEDVGVQFVPDVTPYETMKLRILNGGHASLCYPSALLDVEYVHNSMEHPTIGPFLDCLEKSEMIVAVPAVPNTDLAEYWETIKGRFSNPTLADTIARNSNDGSDRQTKFIIPIIADNLKAGRPVDGLAMVSAMWCRYCRGTTESGQKCGENDVRTNVITMHACFRFSFHSHIANVTINC